MLFRLLYVPMMPVSRSLLNAACALASGGKRHLPVDRHNPRHRCDLLGKIILEEPQEGFLDWGPQTGPPLPPLLPLIL